MSAVIVAELYDAVGERGKRWTPQELAADLIGVRNFSFIQICIQWHMITG
jgi:hypothetical protein